VGDRIYLPVRWFDCIFGCSKEQKADLRGEPACGSLRCARQSVHAADSCHKMRPSQRCLTCKVSAAGYLKRLRPEYKYVTVYTMVRPASSPHTAIVLQQALHSTSNFSMSGIVCRSNHRSRPPSLSRLTEFRPCTPQDKGMVFSALDFPPGLDLLVFSQGATMRGLRTVPLPILKKVGSPNRGQLRPDRRTRFDLMSSTTLGMYTPVPTGQCMAAVWSLLLQKTVGDSAIMLALGTVDV
jgi:hypothetical protein